MRKKAQKRLALLAAVFSLLGIQLYFAAPAARATDTPHNKNQVTPVQCSSCHDPVLALSNPEYWSIQETMVCGQCHNSATPDEDGIIDVSTHKIDENNILAQCTQCHDPHRQMQLRTWKALSYLDTGVTDLVSETTLTCNSKSWGTDQWKGMVLVPNIKAPAYNYRIASNTANSITIESHVSGTNPPSVENTMMYASSGQTFAIVYGRLVKTAVRSRTVKFFRPEGENSFIVGTSPFTGICQVCHTQTSYFRRDGSNTPGDHFFAGPGDKCVICHTHQKGFMPRCDICHGFPPVDTDTLVKTNGSEDGSTGSVTAGAHVKHATSPPEGRGYACSICHGPNFEAGEHNNGFNVTMGFQDVARNGVIGNSSYDGQTTVSYNTSTNTTTVTNSGNKQCSNIYCHSNGKFGYTSPQWDYVRDPAETCSFCHGFPPNTGAHSTHIELSSLLTQSYGRTEVNSNATSYAFGCGNCHPTDLSYHWNGTVDISLSPSDGGTIKEKNSSSAYKTGSGDTTVCNLIYCHSNGAGTGDDITGGASPEWGQTFAGMGGDPCAKCHTNSPTGTPAHGAHIVGMHYNDVFSGGTGTVFGHGNTDLSTTLNCNICHSETVTVSYNDLNTNCYPCHDDDGDGIASQGTLTRGNLTKSRHVSGAVDVIFAAFNFKSRAQLRGDITSVKELDDYWTRNNGYKESTSYDITKETLRSVGTFTSETKSCTVACHNGNYVSWTSTSVSCNSCHTKLP